MMGDIDFLYDSLCTEFADASDSTDDECDHSDSIIDNGVRMCRDCGLTDDVLDFEPEWRNYDGGGTSRCCNAKGNTKSLEKDFVKWDIAITSAIRNEVETKYFQIMEMIREQKDTKSGRGRGRKAIIAACLLFVYRERGDCRTFDELKDMFKLSKKNMFNGLTSYYECFPRDRVQYVTPEDLIKRVMMMTGIDMSRYEVIAGMARDLKNVSQSLNRSKPMSVASAIVYFYLCLNPTYRDSIGMTRTLFAEKTKLSDITISKHVKELAATLGLEIKI